MVFLLRQVYLEREVMCRYPCHDAVEAERYQEAVAEVAVFAEVEADAEPGRLHVFGATV